MLYSFVSLCVTFFFNRNIQKIVSIRFADFFSKVRKNGRTYENVEEPEECLSNVFKVLEAPEIGHWVGLFS